MKESNAFEVALTPEELKKYFPSGGSLRREVSDEELAEANNTWTKLFGQENTREDWERRNAARLERRRTILSGLGELTVDGITGITTFHSETGTEGGHWAFQDRRGISGDGEKWSYEGLHILRNGDFLSILNPQRLTQEVWSGEITLKKYGVFKESAFGFWIHADQIGVPRNTWAKWFFDEYPAVLRKAGER